MWWRCWTGNADSQTEVKDSSANTVFYSLVMDSGIHLSISFHFGKVSSHLVKPEGIFPLTLGKKAELGDEKKAACASIPDWKSQSQSCILCDLTSWVKGQTKSNTILVS